ncbi:hypothetical protein C5N14_28215 [Micromonospora sp. MW-13]|nr:hypothetical protein C5N14_28215 [Micromonospora sp. MW-13]
MGEQVGARRPLPRRGRRAPNRIHLRRLSSTKAVEVQADFHGGASTCASRRQRCAAPGCRSLVHPVVPPACIFSVNNCRSSMTAGRKAKGSKGGRPPAFDRPCPPSLQADLHTAMAQLAGVVAFMLFDAYEHADARRRFAFALQCAEIGGNWHQRAVLLADRADRLTPTERAMLHTVRARALAKFGPTRAQEVFAAVGAADEAFAHSQPSEDPPWMRFYDDAQHHGDTAHALYDVAVSTTLATEADGRFRHSVTHRAPLGGGRVSHGRQPERPEVSGRRRARRRGLRTSVGPVARRVRRRRAAWP